MLIRYQKQASATVKMGPAPYPQSDPPKKQKILEVDCRGLELVSFKPEVGRRASAFSIYLGVLADYYRANGWPKALKRARNSQTST